MLGRITLYFGICQILQLFARGEIELFSSNQEIIFNWNAQVDVGSSIPTVLSSKFNISAQLKIQTWDKNFTIQLGEISSSEELGENDKFLQLPITAEYKSGALVSVAMSSGDVEWSMNIKRALASLLQLDLLPISTGSLAFTSSESGFYGNCKVEYIVQPLESSTKRIKKVLDLSSCQNQPASFWSSSPKFTCANSYQSDIMSHKEREYFVDLDSPVIIKNISTKGTTVLQPYQSQAEAHHSVVSQTLVFKSVGPISEAVQPLRAFNSVELLYQELPLDATHGLPPLNKTIVIQEITSMLGELSDSLWWEVGSRSLNNETMFALSNLLRWLDLSDWEQLYLNLTLGTSYKQETMQHLFWELVPEVGSAASALFIRDLVKTERIKGMVAGRLLVNFPFYQRKPTEELLSQCEEFLHLTLPVKRDVRNSAILSFATLIHKTCSLGCKADTIDRYAKLYLDRFTESIYYEDRMLYLQGLSNIELNQGLDYLAPIIIGQPPTDHHIQFLATWAVLNTVHTNPNKVFELFWPLLNNRSQTLEVRVAAMTMVILSKPSPDRFISLFWYMQTEPSLQLYNFYYTTIKSLTSTTHPCYTNLAKIASQISRFVPKKSSVWATGNYLLDYEDKERGYGGLLQILSIGSERTGLPNVFIFMTEQHTLGVTTSYALYIKLEGVGEGIKRQLHNLTIASNINFQKIAQLLKTIKAPVRCQEEIHMEFIFKVDGRTVITQYLNSSTFRNISSVVKRLSSVYFDFSVNYQRLMFPLFISHSRPTDLGIPLFIQIRSGSLISARGKVKQDPEGRARNTELDLRYSWNGITNLQVYNPMSNKWHGVTRSRSLHIRLPFAVQLHLDILKRYFKIRTIQHKDYVAGSRIGVVWHAVSNLKPTQLENNNSKSLKEEWMVDSLDLGARLVASVFDCPGKSTISDSLHLLKKAFVTKEKNYQMVAGGVALLGAYSLREQLAFQPLGNSCGIMLYFTPLLSKVEPVLILEKNQLSLQMLRREGFLWEMKAAIKKNQDGNRELTFKLDQTPSVDTPADAWRVIRLEGAFVLPSNKASVFNSPSPISGYANVKWGEASPLRDDKAASVFLRVFPAVQEQEQLRCPDYSPSCLQTVTELATHQRANVSYANLPGWLITAAHALFPEHVQTESSSTEIGFSSSTYFPPWNTKGLCAVNSSSVLTIDNTTLELSLTTCFTLLVADCSDDTTFAVFVKKMSDPQYLAVKLNTGNDVIELLPSTNGSIDVFINENIKLNPITEDYEHGGSNETAPHFSVVVKAEGEVEVELSSGVVMQHYSRTVVVLVPGIYRGYTCGLCADYNGDTSTEPVTYYTQC